MAHDPQQDIWERYVEALKREQFNNPPDFVEAHIKLIDALGDYIEANDDLTVELLQGDQITDQQAEAWRAERVALKALLDELAASPVGICIDWIGKTSKWRPSIGQTG